MSILIVGGAPTAQAVVAEVAAVVSAAGHPVDEQTRASLISAFTRPAHPSPHPCTETSSRAGPSRSTRYSATSPTGAEPATSPPLSSTLPPSAFGHTTPASIAAGEYAFDPVLRRHRSLAGPGQHPSSSQGHAGRRSTDGT